MGRGALVNREGEGQVGRETMRVEIRAGLLPFMSEGCGGGGGRGVLEGRVSESGRT